MEKGKQEFSLKPNEKQTNKSVKECVSTKKVIIKDPCPACREELYVDSKYTSRIGLLDQYDEVLGWKCPNCESEFDLEGELVQFYNYTGTIGRA